MARVKYLLIAAIVLLAFNYKPADDVISLKMQPTNHRWATEVTAMFFDMEVSAGQEQQNAKMWGSVELRVDTASKFHKSGFFQMQDIYYINIYHVKRQ